jgi:DNA-binding LacI/PurR family transcriptional regulator/DNA-binding transcriptional regulator YhcF (GntR family)
MNQVVCMIIKKLTKTPALSRALGLLTDSLTQGVWKPGDRLPSLERLAASAQVSRNSMWKTVSIAARQQLVTVTRGGYITAGAVDAGNHSKALKTTGYDRGCGWQKKRLLLERDILDGRYYETRGVLPTAKELQTTYGVCAATLKKMLVSLSENDIIVPYKKTYRIPYVRKKRYQNTILFVSEGIGLGKISVHNERLAKIIDLLEYACSRTGVSVHFIEITATDIESSESIRRALQEREQILGTILNLPFLPEQKLNEAGLFRRLAALQKPLAILDSSGTFTLPSDYAANRDFRIFRIAGRCAGRQVGRFLLGLGHCRIAYVSLLHAHTWSMERLAGIADQFEFAGLPGGVVPFTAEAAAAPSTDAKTPMAAIRKNLSMLDKISSRGFDPDMVFAMRDAGSAVVARKRDVLLAEPYFVRALADHRITAWVGANDGTAFAALQFLGQHRRQVPRDISVIGFDNAPEAFETRLTTYDFGLSTMVHRMLGFIARPALHWSAEPEEVEGIVVERETSGAAKK